MIPRGSTGFEPGTSPAERRDFFDLRKIIRSKTSWSGAYDPSRTLYEYNDIVTDDGWTMVCTESNGCTDRPAPQPTGDPFNIYQGASPTTTVTAKQVLFGNRYTFGVGGYLTGWRIFTVAGNHYIVYSVKDPDGDGEIQELLSFTGVGGWETFGLSSIIVTAGTVFDLIAIVQEPDPTPTTFSGNWNYQTPPNPASPIAGQIVHANSTPSVIAVSTTDADLADRTADLQGIEVGDTLNGPNASWAIQTINELPTFFEFGVAPAVQDAPDGLHEFVFETVSPTPITLLEDIGYWATSPYIVQGLAAVDGATPAPSDNAYGTDIEVQAATISDQWEPLAYTDGLGSSGSSAGPGPWIEPTLLNGWQNLGGAYETAAYRINGDRVEIRGLINGGTVGAYGAGTTAMFILPPEARPPLSILFAQVGGWSNGFGHVDLRARGDGGVYVRYTTGTGTLSYVSINCSFSTTLDVAP